MNLKMIYLFLSSIFSYGFNPAGSKPFHIPYVSPPENNGTSPAVLESGKLPLIDFIVEHNRLLLCALETGLSWFFGSFKDNINNSRPNYYVIFMFAVFQSAGAIGSYMAMKELSQLKNITAGICIASVTSIAICYITSKLVQFETVIKRKDILFLLSDFLVQIIKVFIYHCSGKMVTFADCVKLLSLAICPVLSLILPLIFSKYCDNLLTIIPSCLSKLTNIVLYFSGYKQIKFEAKCLFVKQCNGSDINGLDSDSESCCLENPEIEMFSHKNESVCFLHFVSGSTHWIVKCFTDCVIYSHPKNAVVIQNAIRLNDKVQQIVLGIAFEDSVESDDTENLEISEAEASKV